MLYRLAIQVVFTQNLQPTINYDVSRVDMPRWTGLKDHVHLSQPGLQPTMNFGRGLRIPLHRF